MTTAQRRAGWHKSSHSDVHNGCVEVRFDGERVLVRDSKHPTAGHLALGHTDWQHFLRHAIHVADA